MKNLQLTLINKGWGGVGWGVSKKSKPISTPPHGARLKSRPISAPPPLRGGENPHGAKQGGVCQVGWGKIANPTGNGRLIAGRDDKMLITTRIL